MTIHQPNVTNVKIQMHDVSDVTKMIVLYCVPTGVSPGCVDALVKTGND